MKLQRCNLAQPISLLTMQWTSDTFKRPLVTQIYILPVLRAHTRTSKLTKPGDFVHSFHRSIAPLADHPFSVSTAPTHCKSYQKCRDPRANSRPHKLNTESTPMKLERQMLRGRKMEAYIPGCWSGPNEIPIAFPDNLPIKLDGNPSLFYFGQAEDRALMICRQGASNLQLRRLGL